ncbi:hypothetical protein SAMN02745130_02544 [Thiothrix eikelboomii]|uniref:Ribbon-helix-helix protein, copG family n=1 Tax=Thiothrix eikelboomii TaxID=92487 RepID=A0A1T4X7P0_9GAMM|nr:hypothetical protein [Thiothrix eikelboomii]SKA84861.1 hypothetical protein SAMN02745130_02544 [Thiothrix eikelboomii]
MTNFTITLDEEDLKQARILAIQQGRSLNAIIRSFIKEFINSDQRYQQTTKHILQKAEESTFSSAGEQWTREQLYER